MMKLLPLLLWSFSSWMMVDADPSYNPLPNPDSVVTVDQARFTVLTSRLIRMEWGQTVDSATLTFLNRYLPTPKFDHYSYDEGQWQIIETDYLKVSYFSSGESFNKENLVVEYQINGKSNLWSPQPYTEDSLGGNLLGTVRTLDGNNGDKDLLDCYKASSESDSHCTLGLVSRDGYAVVDDTGYPQFDESEWPWAINPNISNSTSDFCSDFNNASVRSCGFHSISKKDCIGHGCCWFQSEKLPNCYYSKQSHQDLYFFGHGHDYKGALHDFALVAGRIPIPPRYAFGMYYSRYWAYSDIGEMELVNGYRSRNIPLDILVLDMDWHKTFYKEFTIDPAGERKGLTGFTWNDHLFPNPEGFLAWCKANNLKNTLNLHFASGIQKWEDTFNEMVEAMGLNASVLYVPWKPADPKFVNNFLSITLKPLQDMGIDFWWLDWRQGEEGPKTGINIPNLNPTFWINYLFFSNPYQWGPIDKPVKRPFLLHGWGGLGSHRYQIGFSGNVNPSWNSLNYQVSFTLRASNVLFGYWSHDIGGHLKPPPAELYTRWIQWGAFSPIFRIHSSKSALDDRRIWVYTLANYKIMHEFMVLRGSMVPYIYTYARDAYDTGLSLLRALYFEYPEADESYIFKNQYFFGPHIMAAPITQPVNETSQVVNKTIWIPPGSYVSWSNGKLVEGPMNISWLYTLSEMPLFVKSGSIIPMLVDGYNKNPLGSASRPVTSLKLMVFIGDATEGLGILYEDDGVTEGYKVSDYTTTTFTYQHDTSKEMLSLTVFQSIGTYNGFISKRSYQIIIPNFWPAEEVLLNSNSLSYCSLRDSFDEYTSDCWTYDGSTLSLIIIIVTPQATSDAVNVQVAYTQFNVFDPYNINININGESKSVGFTGIVKRLVNIKQYLDDQWGIIHRLYQEDYRGLIDASEAGIRITYSPTDIGTLINEFRDNMEDAYNSVPKLNVNSTLREYLKAQLTLD